MQLHSRAQSTAINFIENPTAARQRWMRAFALGQESLLEQALQHCQPEPSYTLLRKPEAGMLMLEGKAGNQGQRFNLGEMLITRCAVSVQRPKGTKQEATNTNMATDMGTDMAYEGHAYVMGNNPKRALMAALLDALMQDTHYHEHLEKTLVTPLLEQWDAQKSRVTAETASTKVDFFTMVRGEDQ